MKVLLSTPCYGGQVTDTYLQSLLTSIGQAEREGIVEQIAVHTQGKESLISRARNRAAMAFLKGGYDKLLTVDADIQFSYEDLKRIITSDKDIVGGIYSLKTFPVVANFNPLHEHREEFFKSHRGMDYDALAAFAKKYADPKTGEVEVEHVPTGFMCVTQRVLSALSETVPVYGTFDPAQGQIEGFFEFYPSGARNKQYESEDWSFCRLSREAGFKVHVNTKVLLGHMGTHVYRLGQFYGEVDPHAK